MSDDLIRRSDAIEVVRHSSMEFIDADTRQKLIEAIPTIEIPQTPKGDVIGYKWVLEWTLKPLLHTRVPQTQSIEPKRGKWIPHKQDNGKTILWKCSECGQIIYSETETDRLEFHKWCSRCGADMRGKDDE